MTFSVTQQIAASTPANFVPGSALAALRATAPPLDPVLGDPPVGKNRTKR